MHRHPVSPTGVLLFFDLFKVRKMTILIITCSKLAKWLIIMTCSKLAVLNKAIQGTFFKSQKSKNRLKSYLLWKAVANRTTHGTFLSLKKVKKRVYGNYGSIFACDLEKCPGSFFCHYCPLTVLSSDTRLRVNILLKLLNYLKKQILF